MKNYLSALIVFALALSCSRETPPLELFNPDAFAFYLEDEWELNASVSLRNFGQTEENNLYYVSINYRLDLVSPSDTIYAADFGLIEESSEDFLPELVIDSQISLNSEFETGEYKVIFIVEDSIKNQKDTSTASFTLSKD